MELVCSVFALVVQGTVMTLFVYCRVGKIVTPAGAPRGVGAGPTADHLTVLFSQKILAVRKSQRHIPTCYAQFICELFR